ncbi:MAG: hypothetical protein IKJ59_14135 [Clostridia bacterium]|nr:hypothetical protein [Clostridia bacterium]
MGFLGFFIGLVLIGAASDLLNSSDDCSDTFSEGYYNLHNEADRNHGIALNNCENCRYHSGGSCPWQENNYASPSKYHHYVCDNYSPK